MIVACDFDKNMHRAVRQHFSQEQCEIVGSSLHMIHAMKKWIRNSLPAQHVLRTQPDVLQEMTNEWMLMVTTLCEKREFTIRKREFLDKWRKLAGEKFYQYMCRTWMGGENYVPLFGPEMWAACHNGCVNMVRDMNEQAEKFHHMLNDKFSGRPQWKRTIEILRDIEHEVSTRYHV